MERFSEMMTPSMVLMRIAKECDRALTAPKGALWADDELVVVWEGRRPVRIPNVNKPELRNTVATLVHMSISREEPSQLRFRKMLATLARTFDGALVEWSDLLIGETGMVAK